MGANLWLFDYGEPADQTVELASWQKVAFISRQVAITAIWPN